MIPRARVDDVIVVVGREIIPCDEQLTVVVQAGDRCAGRLGLRQCGEEQSRENGNDRDHHQQLDQRECLFQRSSQFKELKKICPKK